MTLAHANAYKVQTVTESADSSSTMFMVYQRDPPIQQENILITALWLHQKQVHEAYSSIINQAANKINLPWMVMPGTCL